MGIHVIGQGEFLEDGDSALPAVGTSIAVRQFVFFANGLTATHAPSQPWRVLEVICEQSYCLGCFGERNFDVLIGEGRKRFSICRCCGDEVMHG